MKKWQKWNSILVVSLSLISSLYIKENNFVKKSGSWYKLLKKIFFITFCKGQANFECDRGD